MINQQHCDDNKSISEEKMDNTKLLFLTPYEKVLKALLSIKDFIISIKSVKMEKVLNDLDFVISTIESHTLYTFYKTSFYKSNKILLDGRNKISDFSNGIENTNNEFRSFYRKYSQMISQNDEISKSLHYLEKNISILNTPHSKSRKVNAISPEGDVSKKSINKLFLSQFPQDILNNYAHNKLIKNINFTVFFNKENQQCKISYNNLNKSLKIPSLDFSNKSIKKEESKILEFSQFRKKHKNKTLVNKDYSTNFHRFNENLKIEEDIKTIKKNKVLVLPLMKLQNENNNSKDKIYSHKKKSILNRDKNIKTEKKCKKISFNKNNQDNNIQSLNIRNHLFEDIDINSIFDFQNFNIFKLKEKLGLENVLPFLGKEIIKNINILHYFEEDKLDNFLYVLSNSYKNKQALYHTALHGADVGYSTLLILTFLKDENNQIENINDIDIISLIISGLAHDVGHPGLNNRFLINSRNELSITYNDNSVLENFHCSKTFQILENNDCNIYSKFSKEDFTLLRKKMIGEILSTDLAYHFKFVSDYKEYKKSRDIKLEQYQLNYITHIADLFHNYRKFEISLSWVELLSNEFWNQGDKEKQLGLPVSFLCDREDINIPKSQIDFLTTFSLPSIDELIEVNIKFELMKNNAVNNLNIWKKLSKENRKKGWTIKRNITQ